MSSRIHFEGIIERTQTYSSWPESGEHIYSIESSNQANVVMLCCRSNQVQLLNYWEVVALVVVTWEGDVPGAETLFIGKLVMMGIQRKENNTVSSEKRNENREIGWDWETMNLGRIVYMQ